LKYLLGVLGYSRCFTITSWTLNKLNRFTELVIIMPGRVSDNLITLRWRACNTFVNHYTAAVITLFFLSYYYSPGSCITCTSMYSSRYNKVFNRSWTRSWLFPAVHPKIILFLHCLWRTVITYVACYNTHTHTHTTLQQ
jgi:hypothetical protein